MFDIVHRVSIADANAHLLSVTTTIRQTPDGLVSGRSGSPPADGLVSGRSGPPPADGQVSGPSGSPRADGDALPSPLAVFMPVWTPGSYLLREYARHVEAFSARADGRPAACRKARKNAWEIAHDGAKVIEIRYLVYANELTVRTNHVDATHAYWNGAATYIALEAAPGAGARVEVEMPAGWDVATALASTERSPASFVAKTFDELCDAPFECGKLIERSFVAHGKTHRIAAWDNADARTVDWEKLETDTRTIVETEASLMAGDRTPRDALPYDRYLFLWHVTPRGRGGLEHRSCATLMAKPASFQNRSGYLDVLSLVAHEFFHLWNVKRIRPAGLSPYRYQEENYTRLLWWFEGATSYYDWRTLRLAGLCTAAEYLNHLAEECVRLEDTPGAGVHALEEGSFDAWIKAYRPDENSLNSTVSYYLKGEIVCALLDLELRRRTAGRTSLDDVVRHLYWEYGAKDVPVPEDALPALIERLSGASFDDCFDKWVRGTQPVQVNEVLGHAGLKLERSARRDGPPASLGVRLRLDQGRAVVEAVPRGGAAHKAGIDAKDEIIAVAGRRVPEGRLDMPLAGLVPGATVPVHIARDGWLRTVELVLDPPLLPEGKIVAVPDAAPGARELYRAWLGEDWRSTAIAGSPSH